MEGDDIQGLSASAKKLKIDDDNFDVNYQFGYRILNFLLVFSAISQYVCCKTCGSDITFHERSPRGLGFKLVISCKNCREVQIPNSSYIGNAYEINRRIVLAMRLLGVGLSGILKFCAIMELPRPIFHSFYDRIVEMLSNATASVRNASMNKAAEDEKKCSAEKGESQGITVSGDGSWKRIRCPARETSRTFTERCGERSALQHEINRKAAEDKNFNSEGQLYGAGIAE